VQIRKGLAAAGFGTLVTLSGWVSIGEERSRKVRQVSPRHRRRALIDRPTLCGVSIVGFRLPASGFRLPAASFE
jgi:hypothetical protein